MRGVQACVNAALCVHGNPLLGAGPKKKPPKEDWEALMEWEHEVSVCLVWHWCVVCVVLVYVVRLVLVFLLCLVLIE